MFKQTKKGRIDERKGRKANKSTITSNSQSKLEGLDKHQEGTQPDDQVEKASNNQDSYPFSESFLDPDFLGQFLDQNTNEILKNEIGTTSKEEPQSVEYLAEKPPNPFKSERKRGKFAGSFSPKKRGSFRNFFSKQKISLSFKDLVENNQTLDPLRQIQSENNGQDKQRYHEREMETFFVKREVGDPKTSKTWRDFSELFGYNVEKDNQSSILSVDASFNLPSSSPQNSPQKKASRASILKNIKSYFKPQQEKVENASDDTLLTPIGPATIIKHTSDSNKKLYQQHPFKNTGPKKVDASAIDFHDLEFLRSSEDELFKPGNAKVSRCSYPDCRDRSNNSKLLCTLGTNQSSCSNYLPKKKADSKQSNVIESKGDCRFDSRKAIPPSYGAKNVSSECRKSMAGSFHKYEQAPDSSLPPKPTQSEVVQNSTIIKPIRKRKISGCNLKIKTEAEAEELEGTSGPVFENFFVTERQTRKSRSPTSNHSLAKTNTGEISSNAHLSGHNIVDKVIQSQKDSKIVVPGKLQIGKSVLKKSNSVSPTRISRKKNYLVFKTKNRVPPNTANSTSAFKKFSRNDDSKAMNDHQIHDASAMYPVSDTQSLVSWHSRNSKKVLHVVNQTRYGRGRGRPAFSGMDKLDKRRSDTKGFIKKYQINDEFPRKVGRITPDSPQISMKEESFETLKSNTLKQFGVGIGRGKKPKEKANLQDQESNSGLGVEIMNNLKRWRERNSPCFLHELLLASDQKPVSKNNQNLEIIMEEKFSSPNQPDKQEV